MSLGWDDEGRYDEFRQFWENGNYDDWDFDALNAGGQDWNVWDEDPGADALWHNTAASVFEPYASSSTLEGNSPPRPARDGNSRARSPSLEYSRRPPRPMGNNTSSSANDAVTDHTAPASHAQNHVQNTTSNQSRSTAAYDFQGRHARTPPLRRTSPFGYIPEAFDFQTFDSQNTPSDSFDGIDIDDILNSDEDDGEEEMPATTRRRQRAERSIVDLTNDSSPPRDSEGATSTRQPRNRKRSATESTPQTRPTKRSRRSDSDEPSPKIEELDLTNEAPSAEEELRQAQQQAAIKAQQAAEESKGPLKIGKRQCIICMEKFTDATITHCGHIYCHECLTQALIAGEKNSVRGVGNCPVCRKPVNRKKGNQMILVNFMKNGGFKGKGRRDLGVFS